MTESHEAPSRRQGHRVPLASISLPLLGTRDIDNLSFQYFLQDASPGGLKIAIPEWVTSWDTFQNGDLVSFFVPMAVEGKVLNQGVVAWFQHNAQYREQYIGVKVSEQAVSFNVPFRLSSDGNVVWDENAASGDLKNLVAELLKDAGLLKKGMGIYLDHLMPYFSRLTSDGASYPELREFLFGDVRSQIEDHAKALRNLAAAVAAAPDVMTGLGEYLDIGTLRKLMESELYQGIFQMAFDKQTILAYLREIKGLENRLYFHFNALVIAQVLALEEQKGSVGRG